MKAADTWSIRSSHVELFCRIWDRSFPVKFVTFHKTPFFIEHLWWLLLEHLDSPKLLFTWENVNIDISNSLNSKYTKVKCDN